MMEPAYSLGTVLPLVISNQSEIFSKAVKHQVMTMFFWFAVDKRFLSLMTQISYVLTVIYLYICIF